MDHSKTISSEEITALLGFKLKIPQMAERTFGKMATGFYAEGGHVRVLQICGNYKLLDFSESINALQWLEKLHIVHCDLPTTLDFVLNLPKMQEIELFGCILEKMPEWMAHLSTLETISFTFNELKDLPDIIASFTKLKTLNLTKNDFMEIPKPLRSIKTLERIFLDDNHIRSVPDWIGELTNLEELNIAYNQIAEIPDSIGLLHKLKRFNCASNRLKDIPRTLLNLKNLEFWSINENEVESLPLALWEKLTGTTAHLQNPWLFPPPEITKRHLDFVVNYLRGYTPDIFLHNIESKLQNGTPLNPEEIHYPDLLRLGAQLEALCERYPESPTTKELRDILNDRGYVGNPRHPHADTGILL